MAKKFKCFECGSMLDVTQSYYKNPASVNGHCCICKDCCLALVLDDTGDFVVRDKMIALLRRLDRPFFQTTFLKFCESNDGYPLRILGGYIGSINRGGYKEYTFSDSDFGDSPEVQEAYKEMGYEIDNSENESLIVDETNVGTQTGDTDNSTYKKTREVTTSRKTELQTKWGKFDRIDYLERCEVLYNNIVAGGYQIMSAMHDVSLKNAVKIQVEYDMALESGQYEKMNKLASQLKTARDEARLNPKQIKEDFAQSGFSTFSEMSLNINQGRGNIYTDMKFIANPHDDIDVLMFEYVNYCRHMMQMPEMEGYGDLYGYYLNRAYEITKKHDPKDMERLESELKKYNLLELARYWHSEKS